MPRDAPGRNIVAIDVIVEHAAWRRAVADPGPLLRRAAKAAVAVARRHRRAPARSVALAVALIDDRAMRKLNRTYRGKDKPTNVLSFPALEPSDPPGGRPRRHPIGDVAIAYDTVRREAEAQGKPLSEHLTHLMVHAVLHLLGYDHETEPEAEEMEALERRALATLGIADPYAGRR